jgi:hypothetical protein
VPYDIWLTFQDDAHCAAVLERLRAIEPLGDGEEVVEDNDGNVRFSLDNPQSADAAWMRANTLLEGALQGSDVAKPVMTAQSEWMQ